MEDKRYIELAQLILRRTKEQNVVWNPSSNANTYQAAIGQGVVLVYFDIAAQDNRPMDIEPPLGFISFLNIRGETLYCITSFTTEDGNFSIIKDLYQLAKDSYLKTNETIQSMFDELNTPF